MRTLLWMGLAASLAAAQAPRFINAQVEARTSSGDLAAQVRTAAQGAGPTWLGYSEPNRGSERSECGVYYLDDNRGGHDRASSMEDAAPAVAILLRLEQGQVARVRTFSGDCAVDAGGAPVVWLNGVAPGQSAALLLSLVDAKPTENSALSALAMTGGIQELIGLAKNDPTPQVRGQALFWLSQRAGEEAVAAITDAIANDPATAVKERAVFGLSQLPKDQGVPLLIQLAQSNPNPAVRKRAMFWLGQSKDPRAVEFFAQLLSKP